MQEIQGDKCKTLFCMDVLGLLCCKRCKLHLKLNSSVIAQSVEQMTVNHWVPGSSPGHGANFQNVALSGYSAVR